MMKTYMVEFRIPQPITEEFAQLIPAQQKHVHRLMLNGKIISYTLSEDRTKLWSVMAGKDKSEISKTIDELPLSSWMKIKINDLTFHGEAQTWKLPALSLN